jgi:hypothetical protein
MKFAHTFPALLLLVIGAFAAAQDEPPAEPRHDFRYAFSAIDDATFYSSLQAPLPPTANLPVDPIVTLYQNQLLLEPSFTLRYHSRWSPLAFTGYPHRSLTFLRAKHVRWLHSTPRSDLTPERTHSFA